MRNEAIGVSINSETRQALTYQDGGNVLGRDMDNAAIYKITRGLTGRLLRRRQ